ncbi:sensor histidine kinase [Cellulomonas sp. URHE0023]|uniref:sensor histidine kinase n=1 Tax=Cellulomonas sp. URHE0023 TaxID=1380354 RepID=UPI0004810D4C|nr:histidine kinase [Cellulomonas sp. URHE0023]
MIDLKRASTAWQSYDVVVRDLPLAVALALGSFVGALHDQGTRLGDVPTRPMDALAYAAVALECLPLAVRRRLPAVCLALVSLGFAIDQLRGYHTVAGVALPVAVLSAAAHTERHRRSVVVVASAAYAVLALVLGRDGSAEGVAGFVTFYLLLAIAWGIGAWLRQTRFAEAEHRRHAAESARVAERTRLAAELHDVVTHHVTAMVVQAEAARYLTAQPDRLDQSLTAVSDTGRQAISDLRHLLEVLDPDGPRSRTPTVGELQGLIEQTRQAGQPVEYVEEGRPSQAPGSAEVVAYRVVQEGLTNALKHAHGSRTVVRVQHEPDGVTVEVRTDGPSSPGASPGGSGRGLAGLRERVGLLGGELSAGRQVGGAFVVRARIPGTVQP